MVTTDCPGYDPADRSAWYIAMTSFFIWWAFQLFLEKYCNMAPVIRRTVSLREIEEHIQSAEEREQKKEEREDHLEDLIMNSLGPNAGFSENDEKDEKDEKEVELATPKKQ
eukprot:201174_1